MPAPAVAGATLKGRTTVEEPDRAARAIARRSAEIRATAVLISACATALREFPHANGAYRDGRYELYSRINVALTIHTAGSQVAATVLDAHARSLPDLDRELARLRDRARTGGLTPPEQAGATFTLSDLGEYGIHRGVALVVPPQAAALTAGAIRALPVLRGGVVVPGHELTLTLTCDHRILFGARAAAFLARIAELVERPG